MLLDEIPEGLWEVDFFENSSEKNLIIPAADGQLEKSDLGLSDMDSGHVDGSIFGPWDCQIWILGVWMVPYPVLIRAATSKNIYKTCIKHSRKIPKLYIKLPINPP